MVRCCFAFLLVMLLWTTAAWSANGIPLTDSAGTELGTLPFVARGDERLVPLAMLVRAAEWKAAPSDGQHVILLPTDTVSLRLGNAFVRSGDHFVQLRLPPEEWDGSLWVPLSNLRDLFPNDIEIPPDLRAVRVRIAPPVVSDTSQRGSAETQAERWVLRTVVVDPGHGGKDSGARGLYNLREKEVTLDIARRLARLLTEQGLNVELTRTGDRFVSLQDRTRLANEKHGDLFISIHTNSSRRPDSHGVEAYFLKPARTQRAIEAAMRENDVVKLENGEAQYQDLTQDNYILLTMATSQYMRDSETWAAHVVRLASSSVGLESRGVDQAGFYVLMGASMPAVLVECGFLSNPDDAKVLASERGRQRIAEALLESVLRMKTNLEGSASR
jgi:N-acetylmuramoyl-L-alanine amidase